MCPIPHFLFSESKCSQVLSNTIFLNIHLHITISIIQTELKTNSV